MPVEDPPGSAHGKRDKSRGRSNSRSESVKTPVDNGPKRIRSIASIKELYKLAGEVMPSTHSYIKVLFGKRLSDGEETVVKVREKPKCFRTVEDERSWRRRTEHMLNLPLPDHVGICRLYEVLEDSEGYYIVMERVRGADLFETLDADGPMTVDMTREILRHLLVSVMHMHWHNVLHKDLKLENIILNSSRKKRRDKGSRDERGERKATREGSTAPSLSIKVIDFDTVDEWHPHRDLAKTVVGTDQYIAPEAYGGKYTPLSDMFAVGVIAYKLLTGKFPFAEEVFDVAGEDNGAASSAMTTIRRRLKAYVINFDYPIFKDEPDMFDLVSRLMSYNELQRPSAAAAMQHPAFRDSAPRDFVGARSDYFDDLIDDDCIVAEAIAR
eukprot:TRINITY_DN82146_c0_g1_i1.p1 TRINITY_DN82146_c0_g1~~TRINITY_DN82146_c0_g1_i1.p1  ORF type:complete len:383 (-),score=73.39 TRINITY_DN82146_c0_g1_i1:152-1300(-)